MTRKPPIGTAGKEVLLKLVERDNSSWSLSDGTALYESRALTDRICQGLALGGLLRETRKNSQTVYTVTAEGVRMANALRRTR